MAEKERKDVETRRVYIIVGFLQLYFLEAKYK